MSLPLKPLHSSQAYVQQIPAVMKSYDMYVILMKRCVCRCLTTQELSLSAVPCSR